MFSQYVSTKYTLEVIKEKYEKENRYYRVHDSYVENLNTTPLTGKFWARHDQDELRLADPELFEKLKLHLDAVPNKKYPRPVLESHVIGWFAKQPFIPLRKDDRRFYCPRR